MGRTMWKVTRNEEKEREQGRIQGGKGSTAPPPFLWENASRIFICLQGKLVPPPILISEYARGTYYANGHWEKKIKNLRKFFFKGERNKVENWIKTPTLLAPLSPVSRVEPSVNFFCSRERLASNNKSCYINLCTYTKR